MFIKRLILPKLEKYLENDEVIVLTGFRRVGKSTLVKYLYDNLTTSNKIFLDMESPVNQEIFNRKNYDSIISELQKMGLSTKTRMYVFLDEVQLIKTIPSTIKYLFDHYKIKFVLTGSSSFYLKNHFTESLSGRKFIFELMPLTFEEFLWFKESKFKISADYDLLEPFYNEYLEFGGLPAVTLAETPADKKLELDDALGSYFQLDVSNLAGFNDTQNLKNLLFLLASRVGSKVDVTKLSESVGVSRQTMYNYLQFFEDTYLIHQIPMFSRSEDIILRKTKKLYFFDTGILNRIGKVSEGSLFENKIFNQLEAGIKYFDDNRILESPISYFQKKSGLEIDFIVNSQSSEYKAYEIKLTAGQRDLSQLARLSDKLKINNYYVVSKNKVNSKSNNIIYPFNI